MAELTANGLRFHVQTLHGDVGGAGEGAVATDERRPTVVMLHGLVADNLSSYYYTIANPVALEADVYLYDLRGHGRTEMPETGYTVADSVDDLEALLDAWGIDQPVHLFGNSFGCVVSLAFAHRHPERVASLFLIEAHFAVEGWSEHMAGSLALAAFGLHQEGIDEWMATNGDRKLTRLARHSERLLMKTSLIDDLQKEEPFRNEWLEAISCPVYAMYGSESDILDRARQLEAHVPGCELEIVEGNTHSLLTEAAGLVRERAVAWMRAHGGT
jgi:pimeloyl-ACP methyl ester carboxylesterase